MTPMGAIYYTWYCLSNINYTNNEMIHTRCTILLSPSPNKAQHHLKPPVPSYYHYLHTICTLCSPVVRIMRMYLSCVASFSFFTVLCAITQAYVRPVGTVNATATYAGVIISSSQQARHYTALEWVMRVEVVAQNWASAAAAAVRKISNNKSYFCWNK